MKQYFKITLKGADFFKTYLLFFIPIVALSVATAVGQANHISGLLESVLTFVQNYLSNLLGFAFSVYILANLLFMGAGYTFAGNLKDFAPRLLKWSFLTLITLGIYFPWAIKNEMNYYLKQLKHQNGSGEFLSRPARLLGQELLILVLTAAAGGAIYYLLLLPVGAILAGLLFLLISLPLMIHYGFLWGTNIKFAGYSLQYKRSWAETVKFLALQALLNIITLGIHFPASIVKSYRFLVAGIAVRDESGQDAGRFGFDGRTGEGFGLLWGQILLSIITLGLYGSWAWCKVENWFTNQTYLEGDIKVSEQS